MVGANGALHQLPALAQLRAILNIVPAHAWYALPNGALTFLNARLADYLGLPEDHPQRFGTDTGADWESNLVFLDPEDREETRRTRPECLRTGCGAVESPLFEARSEAVIAAAKKSAADKPIRHVVLSHFHDDHMGGVRTYAAEGAGVIVHSSAGGYVRAVLGQRHAVEPDRLEMMRRNGRQVQPAFMLVEDSVTLSDGTREVKLVKLYHVPNLHTPGVLVGYVPDARVLFTADLVSDTFPLIPPLASSVYELIQTNELSVEMIACGHGNAMRYAQLAYVLGKSARNTDTVEAAEIEALEQRLIDGIKAKDVNQIMNCYSDDLFAYDVVPPRQYVGGAAFRKPWQGFLGMLRAQLTSI